MWSSTVIVIAIFAATIHVRMASFVSIRVGIGDKLGRSLKRK
jgi:hypothetical protein